MRKERLRLMQKIGKCIKNIVIKVFFLCTRITNRIILILCYDVTYLIGTLQK